MARIPKRLGLGEYGHPPSEDGTPQDYWQLSTARSWFLDAVQEHAPYVLKRLAEEPLSLYRPIHRRGGMTTWRMVDNAGDSLRVLPRLHPGWQAWPLSHSLIGLDVAPPDEAAFNDSLIRWAKRWNLPIEVWCLGEAVSTVTDWALREDRGLAVDCRWHRLGPGPNPGPPVFSDEEIVLMFSCDGWDPTRESKSAALVRIEGLFRAHVEDHVERQKRRAHYHGLESVPELRSPREHFAWLVRYQVARDRYSEIARDVGKHRQTVVDAVQQAAQLATVSLRPSDRPGAPRKGAIRRSKPRPDGASRIVRLSKR